MNDLTITVVSTLRIDDVECLFRHDSVNRVYNDNTRVMQLIKVMMER